MTGAGFYRKNSGVVEESDVTREEMNTMRKTERLPSYFPADREVVKSVLTLNIN